MTKLFKFLPCIFIAVLLAACGDGPSNASAKKDAENYVKTQTALLDTLGFKLSKIKRTKGWEEGTGYMVRHDMEFVAERDYGEMVVAAAKALSKEPPLVLALTVEGLKLSMAMDGSEFSKRVDKWKESSEAQVATVRSYIAEEAGAASSNSKHSVSRTDLVTLALISLSGTDSNLSIPLGMKNGEKYTYYVQLLYRKTDKGWELSS